MNQPVLREAAVTKYAFEEVYFSKDSIDGNSKYTFQFPSVWNGLPTKKKAIGFRYAKCVPTNYYISFDMIIFGCNDVGDVVYDKVAPLIHISLLVTESNTLAEIVYEIEKQINEGYKVWYPTADETTQSYYDGGLYVTVPINRNDDGSYNVKFVIHSKIKNVEIESFHLSIGVHNSSSWHSDTINSETHINDTQSYINFFKVFNANWNIDYVVNGVNDFDGFRKCWNRKHLYIHSDITTNTNYQLLDRIDTFYRKPSKIYEHNDSGNVFHIWVSFDGKHKQELLYDEIEVALCFMADVRESYV